MSNLSFLFFLTVIAVAYGIPLLTSNNYQESDNSEDSQLSSNGDWNAATFAELDRPIRPEELEWLTRMVIKHGESLLKSPLNQESSAPVFNDDKKEKEALALFFGEHEATSASRMPSESETFDDQAVAKSVRAKKFFGYYPARG